MTIGNKAQTTINALSPPQVRITETWISVAEAAAILHLKPNTVIRRAEAKRLPVKIAEGTPFTFDGQRNYIIRLELLPHKAQIEYLVNHLPPQQFCNVDLATPRSTFGDVWLAQLIGTMDIARKAIEIQDRYRNTGQVKKELSKLARTNGISLSTLYRLCSKPTVKKLSLLYLDPFYLQPHLPRTMCLWSADFAYALFLDSEKHFSQNSIFNELEKKKGTSCDRCPYNPNRKTKDTDKLPICEKCPGSILVPSNRRTVNRLLSHIPQQMICYAREGVRKWRSDYGHATLRSKPILVNELWQGDHHVFDVFVRITIQRSINDRVYEKEIAVRPVWTVWYDTATSVPVGWVVSILPNADTIAEAFCRAATATVGDEFTGLPRAILVDCGKDYRSALLEDLPEDVRISPSDDDSTFLNRRFAGLGLLPALGVTLTGALPYHPQSKSIERFFGTIEQRWISKLVGWCHSSVQDRPKDFSKKLKRLLKDKKLMTLEEFVLKLKREIIPEYLHFHETETTEFQDWSPALASMSPLERYHALEKPYNVIPDWKTLSILKRHHKPDCKIQEHGIQFSGIWYWHDDLRHHMGLQADIFYHAVEKPLVPSSITVTVNGEHVCEAFPAHMFPYIDADQLKLDAEQDLKTRHEQEIHHLLTRINRSAAGILPPEATASSLPEKAQLRDYCYTTAIQETASKQPEEVASLSDCLDTSSQTDAVSQVTSQSTVQELLTLLFGE